MAGRFPQDLNFWQLYLDQARLLGDASEIDEVEAHCRQALDGAELEVLSLANH